MNPACLNSVECSSSVLVAHPTRLVREGIAGILRQAGFVVLDHTDAIGQLPQIARGQRPDVLLVDWELLEGEVDIMQALATDFLDSCIVIFGLPQPSPMVGAILGAGARGCLSLELSPEELVEPLSMIAKGDIVVSRGMAQHLVQGLDQSNNQEELFSSLSERQREIISLVVDGLTNREIANTLIITENTVKVHLRNILDKLDLRNRQQLAAVAAQGGFFRNSAPSDLS
jgi:two-component system, NarL family, nitrate/nitrite response regulator NarL